MESSLHERIAALSRNEPALADDLAVRGAALTILDAAGVKAPPLVLPGARLRAKLERGVPLLDGEAISIPPETAKTFGRLAVAWLADPEMGRAAETVLEAVRLHRLHAEQLAGEALAGHGDHIAELAVPADVPPALLETLADLAVRPLLVAMAERLGPGLTLRPWERGFCPICGAWPLYAERATDTSSLRCSRCLTCWAWDLPRCPHCQKSRLASLNTLAASDLGLWSVDGCDTCGRYLKISGAARSGRLASVLLVDLETWALDRAALAQGLGRPEGVGYRLELADEDEELDDD